MLKVMSIFPNIDYSMELDDELIIYKGNKYRSIIQVVLVAVSVAVTVSTEVTCTNDNSM